MRYFCGILLASFTASALTADPPTETNSLGMELRLLEGGRYLRGTDGGERAIGLAFPLSVNAQYFGNPESPRHVTWITKPFWIASTEVTVGQWKQFVEATGYVTTAENSEEGMVGWEPTPDDTPLYQSHDFERKSEFSWRNPGFEQTDDHPVVGVSWEDVQAFLRWLGEKEGATYRLPTEAEWEFACRGGTDTWFSFGDEPRGVVHKHANLANVELEKHRKHSAERQWLLDWDTEPEDGNVFTAPVGSYEPNAFVLHDMHGNVWEWCQDLWLDTFYKRYDWPDRGLPREIAVDPVNESEPQMDSNRFRSIRGGSWYNGPVICRSANRTGWDEPDAAAYIGFRVVREADPEISKKAREAFEAEEEARSRIVEAGGSITSSDGLSLALDLKEDACRPDLFPLFARLPELKKLTLNPREPLVLSQEDLDAISNATSLEELDFRGSFDPSAVDLSCLSDLPSLSNLRFSRSTPLADADLAELVSITSLTEFGCFGTSGGISDAGITNLSGNKQLEILRLEEVNADGSFLAEFTGAPLKEFFLTVGGQSEGSFTDANAKRLTSFPDLREISLKQQGLLTDATLLTLGDLSNLDVLDLSSCSGFTASGFAPLGRLEKLRTLNLQRTAAGDEMVAALSSVPRIEGLRFGSPNLTDAGFEHLAKLFSLKYLYIENCLATDEGIRHLGRINRLEQLDIGASGMIGTGLGPLTELPELRDVRLRSPALTNIVFEQFARAKSVKKLRFVERGWEPPSAFTNEGILALASATWMTEIWLPRNDTGLTEEGIAKLDEMMPKTSVIPYTVQWDKPQESDAP